MAKVALVTGASGYLAGWLIKKLIERGYTVRGTVRNAAHSAWLKELFPELIIYEADLLKPDSFDEAVQGVEVVFHTASPFFVTAADPQKELIEPALKGTLSVLGSVDKSPSVKRVVVTSSVAAVAGKREPGHVYTEADWNLDSTTTFEPYRYSKRLAEEAAWEFSKGKPWSLVVMNPAAIFGPVLSVRSDATSIKTGKALLDGSFVQSGCPPLCYGVIDVRDAAEAHIIAYEKPEANGRYLLTSPIAYSLFEHVETLRKSGKFTQFVLPTKEAVPVTNRPKFDASKAQRELGINFIPVEQSVVEFAESLVQFGIVKA